MEDGGCAVSDEDVMFVRLVTTWSCGWWRLCNGRADFFSHFKYHVFNEKRGKFFEKRGKRGIEEIICTLFPLPQIFVLFL